MDKRVGGSGVLVGVFVRGGGGGSRVEGGGGEGAPRFVTHRLQPFLVIRD